MIFYVYSQPNPGARSLDDRGSRSRLTRPDSPEQKLSEYSSNIGMLILEARWCHLVFISTRTSALTERLYLPVFA